MTRKTTDAPLHGKTAVITGSNSGIGLGVAHELAKAGADIVLNSFTDNEEDHKLAADMAAEHGVKVRYIKPICRKVRSAARSLSKPAGAISL